MLTYGYWTEVFMQDLKYLLECDMKRKQTDIEKTKAFLEDMGIEWVVDKKCLSIKGNDKGIRIWGNTDDDGKGFCHFWFNEEGDLVK